MSSKYAVNSHGNNKPTQSAENVVTQPRVVVVQLRPDQTKTPIEFQCDKCNKLVTTSVTMVSGSYADMCCCLICCLGGVACCLCLIPYCNDSFMDAEHRCPECNNVLGVCKAN